MAKCPQCGKSLKGLKKHIERMHGGGSQPASAKQISSDSHEPWTGQGELGRIMDIAEAGEPLRAKQLRDLYLNDFLADNPPHDVIHFESPSGKLWPIAKIPAGNRRII